MRKFCYLFYCTRTWKWLKQTKVIDIFTDSPDSNPIFYLKMETISFADAAPYIPPPEMGGADVLPGDEAVQLPSGDEGAVQLPSDGEEAAQLPSDGNEASQLPSGPEGEINNDLPEVESPYRQVELVLDHEISELKTNVMSSVSHAIQTGTVS